MSVKHPDVTIVTSKFNSFQKYMCNTQRQRNISCCLKTAAHYQKTIYIPTFNVI